MLEDWLRTCQDFDILGYGAGWRCVAGAAVEIEVDGLEVWKAAEDAGNGADRADIERFDSRKHDLLRVEELAKDRLYAVPAVLGDESHFPQLWHGGENEGEVAEEIDLSGSHNSVIAGGVERIADTSDRDGADPVSIAQSYSPR